MRYNELFKSDLVPFPRECRKLPPLRCFCTTLAIYPAITGTPFEFTEGGARSKQPSLAALLEFTIDGDNYAVTFDDFDETDFEDIE